MKDRIDIKETLYNIVSKYPETLDLFIANGFPQLKDTEKLKSLGSMVSLEMALKSKNKSPELYLKMLEMVIGQDIKEETKGDITISGILPCPVKIPLIDGLNEFHKGFTKKENKTIGTNLKSASGGVQWLEDDLKDSSIENYPDILVSAGFEALFTRNIQDNYSDLSARDGISEDYKGVDFIDPKGKYTIISGVPAIFLVNTQELNGRKSPKTWDDILGDEFENSIALPVDDLDLFNAVCLTLQKSRGDDAIKALGRNLLKSMHPAQMVKSGTKKDEKPAITVLPWFFTKMVFPGSGLEIVWPEDGAILSPIFVTSKKSKERDLKPIVDWFTSKEVGDILSVRGYFPSLNPDVDNRIPVGGGFQFLGWDYIYNNNLSTKISECMELFNNK